MIKTLNLNVSEFQKEQMIKHVFRLYRLTLIENGFTQNNGLEDALEKTNYIKITKDNVSVDLSGIPEKKVNIMDSTQERLIKRNKELESMINNLEIRNSNLSRLLIFLCLGISLSLILNLVFTFLKYKG